MSDPTSEHDATAAYAVDALEPSEARAAEAHLAGCAACRAELAAIREALAVAADEVADDMFHGAAPPSAGLRQRVMDALDDVPQLPSNQPADPPADPLAARRARASGRSRRWLQGLAAAAAVVVVAGAAVAGASALRWRGEAQAARQAALSVAQVAAAPDATTVAAQATDADVDAGWSGTRVLVSRSLGEAVLVTSGAEDAPDGSTWQLWFVTGDEVRSAGLVTDDDGAPAVLEGAVGAATAVAVTLEPDGGSATPSTTPVAVYPLRA